MSEIEHGSPVKIQGTVDVTEGYLVNGSPLNFSHLAGSPPAGDSQIVVLGTNITYISQSTNGFNLTTGTGGQSGFQLSLGAGTWIVDLALTYRVDLEFGVTGYYDNDYTADIQIFDFDDSDAVLGSRVMDGVAWYEVGNKTVFSRGRVVIPSGTNTFQPIWTHAEKGSRQTDFPEVRFLANYCSMSAFKI